MYFIFIVLFCAFLFYVAGRETRWGGLGFLWRASAVLFVLSVVVFGVVVLKEVYDNRNRQEIQIKKQNIENDFNSRRNIAKEAYQKKWGYTDTLLESIARNSEYYTDPSYKYHHMDYTQYCIVHDEVGCSIYGKDDGVLLEASPSELELRDVVEGTYSEGSLSAKEELKSGSLVWLIDVKK